MVAQGPVQFIQLVLIHLSESAKLHAYVSIFRELWWHLRARLALYAQLLRLTRDASELRAFFRLRLIPVSIDKHSEFVRVLIT